VSIGWLLPICCLPRAATMTARLEITALGDAVNECACIQESAQPGEILASKELLSAQHRHVRRRHRGARSDRPSR